MQRSILRRILIAISLCFPAMVIADITPLPQPSDDPIFKTYAASDPADKRFRETLDAAQRVRNEKAKQATAVFVAAISPAATQLHDARKKALSSTLIQYDMKIKDFTRQGQLDEALKLREAKNSLIEIAKSDDERLASELQAITREDAGSTPDSHVDETFQQRQVKQQIVPIATFIEKYSKAFPAAANLSRAGNAAASSTSISYEEPWAALGGSRQHETWWLRGSKGWFQVGWNKPVVGEYLLIFGRSTPADKDLWGKSHLEINGQAPISIEKMGPQQVLIIDLGREVSIRSLKLDFDGVDSPGFAGLEIHHDMKR